MYRRTECVKGQNKVKSYVQFGCVAVGYLRTSMPTKTKSK